IAFQSLMLASVAAADAVMLGKIEQDSMSAVSLATQIQFIQNMILGTVTAGGAILGAQYWGKNDKETVKKIFAMMLRLAALASFLFFIACIGIPELLMKIFADETDLISIGAGYLRIAGWSYLLTGVSQCYLTIMKITDHAGRSALISSGAVVLNIILNAVFIFGLFGVPAMGAKGAAIATLISRVVELVWAIVSSSREGYIHPKFSHFFKRYSGLSADFRKVAIPILGGSLFWGIGFTSYTAIMGHLGGDAAAANAVAAVVRDLFCCLCNGIASAGGIIVGMELGAGNLERGKLFGNRIAVMSFIIGFFSTGLVLLVTPAVVNFMKLTDAARHYLVGMMVVMAIYMIGRCVNTIVINGIFSAGGDTLFDVYSLAVCMWGIAIPTALLGAFVLHWPVVVVYACTCLDEVGKIPWVMYHYKKYKWVKDLTREVIE
ncbi:MAG: polysaccharide biosynthesis C-terminal domain-containing protein, partial [Acetatifactor sp.]|nr:polysaccharide biosynthesis C-terminal domain-containing protein [Acetatifactor sp.]